MRLRRPLADWELALEAVSGLGLSLWEHRRGGSDVGQVAARDRARVSAVSPDHVDVRRIGRAVVKISRFVPGGSNCLVRAQTVRRMLARRGLDCVLRFAVRNDARGGLEAHAWVVSGGVVVVGKGCPEGYRALEPANTARNS